MDWSGLELGLGLGLDLIMNSENARNIISLSWKKIKLAEIDNISRGLDTPSSFVNPNSWFSHVR